MLKLTVVGGELFDQSTSTFSKLDDVELELEHSLVSLSKWESKFQKPFLTNVEKSNVEILWYFWMMILTPNVGLDVMTRVTQQNLTEINAYIESKQSATTFGDMPTKGHRGETVTSELIYYWMVAFNIPFECQHWHINRLFSLIRICNIKQEKPKKMNRHEIAQRNRELNARRRQELGTSG